MLRSRLPGFLDKSGGKRTFFGGEVILEKRIYLEKESERE